MTVRQVIIIVLAISILISAKTKNHLFIDGKLINNIDPNTFKFIGNYIFSD
jgi:hypothetical protein